MNLYPCDVIRDLLPSYIDGLTSEATVAIVKEHLAGCEACRAALESMLPPDRAPQSAPESKEIDFLKKNKKHNRRILFGSIAAALALIAAVFCCRVFLIGETDSAKWVPAQLQVEENRLSVSAVSTDSASAVAKLTFAEENGVITISARTVLVSPLVHGPKQAEYTAAGQIREVRVGKRIVWADGATVSASASELFATRHLYIGDMTANQKTAQALGVAAYLGPYLNELKTSAEPYGWKILLQEEIDPSRQAQKERDMDAFGAVLIALIGNLNHVTFVYTAGGEQTRTITAADASKTFGEDVKTAGADIRALDRLLEAVGLALYARPDPFAFNGTREISVRVVNQSDTELRNFGYDCYKNGELCSSAFGENADGSPYRIGDVLWVRLEAEDFYGEWPQDAVLEMAFSFTTAAGASVAPEERVRLVVEPGSVCEFRLVGTAETGYRLEQ